MCILCADWIKEKLNITEVNKAGAELLSSAKTDEEFLHILERMEKLEEELEDK